MRASFASIALAVALVACGGKSHPATMPPPGGDGAGSTTTVSDAEFEATMKAAFAFVADLADDLGKVAGQDCATIAKTIDDSITAHQDVIDTANRYQHDPGLQARAAAWVKAHQDELNESGRKMSEVVDPCKDDPAVQAAAQKLAPPPQGTDESPM